MNRRFLEASAPFDERYPVKPGDWVADREGKVARVKQVHLRLPQDPCWLVDLILYSDRGDKIGRQSPPMGGPRTFEPCCPLDGWRRIDPPHFPIGVKWVREDGTLVARKWPGDALPWRKWKRPAPRGRAGRTPENTLFRLALEKIADGANDARAVARDALRQKDDRR